METILKKFIVIVVIPTIILFGELADTILFQNVEKSLEMKEKIKQMAFYECSYSGLDFDEITVYKDPEEDGCFYIGLGYDIYYYWFNSNTEMLYECTMRRGKDVPFEPTMERIIDKKGEGGNKISGYHEDLFPWRDVIAIGQQCTTNGVGNITLKHDINEFLFLKEPVPKEIIEIWCMVAGEEDPPWAEERFGGGLVGFYTFNGLTGELILHCTDSHFYRGCHEDLNQLIKQYTREDIPELNYNLYSEEAIEYWAKKNFDHAEEALFVVATDPRSENCFFITIARTINYIYSYSPAENIEDRAVYWFDGKNYKLYLVDQTDPYDRKEKGRKFIRDINREEMDKQIKEMYDSRVIWKEQK